MPWIHFVPLIISAGTIVRNLKLTAQLHLVPSQRMREGIALLYNNQMRYLLLRSSETIWPAPVPGCNSGRLSVSSDSDKPSKATWKLYVLQCFINLQDINTASQRVVCFMWFSEQTDNISLYSNNSMCFLQVMTKNTNRNISQFFELP